MRLHQRLRRDQGRHTDDWLITYADTITLLLCLFVVILSIRTSEKTIRRETPAPADHAPLIDGIFGARVPIFVNPVPPVETAAKPEDEPPPVPINDVPIVLSRPVASIQAVPRFVEPPVSQPVVPAIAPPPMPTIVDRLQSDDRVVVRQGDRITSLQISSAAFFASGTAALSGAGRSILSDVAVTLKSPEFAAYHISIEGHTDDMPINTAQFQSNWELSTARAVAVVRFFLEEGIPARKLTAAGYADTFPLARNRNEDGTVNPENQAKNRRVVIKLENIQTSEP